MRYLLIILFPLFSWKNVVSQTPQSSIDYWINNLEEIFFMDGSDLDLSTNFIDEFNSDVFSYFDIEDAYDTPLKKLNFQKTEEFKKLSDSLAKRKVELKKIKYIKFNVHDHEHLEYNLNKKGFSIWTNFIDKGFDNAKYKNTIGYLKFNHFPFTLKKTDPYSETYDQYLFIPVNTEIAEKIEDKNNTTYLYLFFQPISTSSFKLAFSEEKEHQIICNGKRLIIAVNDEVVYNKEIIPVKTN
jgi:hypothetical protein